MCSSFLLSLCFSYKEKEKLYVELKHILARQPGPEAAEQLQQCQWTIRERTKKLKVHSDTLSPNSLFHFFVFFFVSSCFPFHIPILHAVLFHHIRFCVSEIICVCFCPLKSSVYIKNMQSFHKSLDLCQNVSLSEFLIWWRLVWKVSESFILYCKKKCLTYRSISISSFLFYSVEVKWFSQLQHTCLQTAIEQYGITDILSPQSLIAELRVLDSKLNEYTSENQRLSNELTNIKKKYLSQKKLHRWASSTGCVHIFCLPLRTLAAQLTMSSSLGGLCVSSVSREPRPRWSSWICCPSWAASHTSLEEASGSTTLWEDNSDF